MSLNGVGRVARRAGLAAAVFVGSCGMAAAQAPVSRDLEDRMAKGKLEADLGHYERAAQEFMAIAQAVAAPSALRAEASVRLGAVRRAAGDYPGAIEAFEQVRKQATAMHDGEMLKLLVQALGEALPGPERWQKIWADVAFGVDRSDPDRPALRVTWPGVPARTARTYAGHRIAVEFKDADLNDVFRQFADITRLNVVVHPGSRGRVTLVTAEKLPWDEALSLLLAPNGLAYLWEGNVVRIARPEQLAAADSPARAGRARKYEGTPIDIDFRNTDLREVLAWVADKGGVRIKDLDPAIQGRVTLKLDAVPWDQAFDVIVSVNGLGWRREADGLVVRPRYEAAKPGVDR